MLARIGAGSIEELFETIPASLREAAALKLPPAQAERAEERSEQGGPQWNRTTRSMRRLLQRGQALLLRSPRLAWSLNTPSPPQRTQLRG